MRRLLILAVLLASPAAAQTAGEGGRYSDAPAAGRPIVSAAPQPYSGRLLTWAGKTSTHAPSLRPATSPPGFADATPHLRDLSPRPSAAFQPQAPAPVRQAPVQQTPVQQAQAVTAAPSPPSAPAAPAARAAPNPPSPPPAPRAPLPTSLYSAAPAHGPVLAGGPPAHSGTEARLYSLHREYGLQPDAIPEAPAGPQRYVLIGPPDHAAPARATDPAPAGGLADAPF